MLKSFLDKLLIILVLVKRDYALQFAGSVIGVFWMFIQSLSLFAIYSFVFLFFNKTGSLYNSASDAISYILSGMVFWIPLQEMLIRGVTIITDNRNLIKRSRLGMDLFLWISFVQMLIHFTIVFLPVSAFVLIRENLNFTGFLLGFPLAFLSGLFLMPLLYYLSKANILLKDISPVIRLISQGLFWTLPILYTSSGKVNLINVLNPFYFLLEIFRYCFIRNYEMSFFSNQSFTVTILSFSTYLLLFLIVYFLTKRNLNSIVGDHL